MLEKNAVKLAKRLASELPDSANVEAVRQDYPETWVVSLGGSFFHYDRYKIFGEDELETIEGKFPMMAVYRELGKAIDRIAAKVIDGSERRANLLAHFVDERLKAMEEAVTFPCSSYPQSTYGCSTRLLQSEVEESGSQCPTCKNNQGRWEGRVCASDNYCYRKVEGEYGKPALCTMCEEEGRAIAKRYLPKEEESVTV